MKLKKHEVALIIFLAIVIVVAGIVIFVTLREYTEGDRTYLKFQDYVFLPEETPSVKPDSGENAGVSGTPVPEDNNTENDFVDMNPPIVDFAGLQALNPDILGWIYSPGTPINYPIVQGDTNDEYLYRMVDRTSNRCGSIFLDCINDREFQDANSVIHGHNMNNGSMFGELRRYAEQEYYDTHTVIWLVTPDQTYSIEIFTAFVTDVDSEVWKLTFSTEEEFSKWKSEMAKKSYFKSKVFPQEGEKVVTLSTCSYDFDNAHFIVMGVLRPKEDN